MSAKSARDRDNALWVAIMLVVVLVCATVLLCAFIERKRISDINAYSDKTEQRTQQLKKGADNAITKYLRSK